MWNVETSYLCPELVDGQVNRKASRCSGIGGAGLRCWKKSRHRRDNGADTGSIFALPEREQTSGGYLVT